MEDDKIMQPLKPVIRIATAEDKKKDAKNRDKEKEAFEHLFGEDPQTRSGDEAD